MVKMPFEKNKTENLSAFDIEKLIDKGAPVKSDIKEEDPKKWNYINLRIPYRLLIQIDDQVKNMVGVSRTGWILQTLQKELIRECTSHEKH